MKMYKTYNKVKRYFVKPKLVWYFGRYRNDPSKLINRKTYFKLFGKYYYLPWWLKFEFTTYDVLYKYKWNQVRFEYPPKWSLVLFGISLSFWLVPPTKDIEDNIYSYWESIINWSEKDSQFSTKFKEHLIDCGYWRQIVKDKYIGVMAVRKEWIKPEFHTSWEIAKSILTEQAKEKEVILL